MFGRKKRVIRFGILSDNAITRKVCGRSPPAGGAARRRSGRRSTRPSAGPQGPVEADRGLVPVEHRPLQPAAAALDGQPGQHGQQRLADPPAAVLGLDEDVFEVEPRLAAERRERREPECEADRLAVHLGDRRLGRGPGAEEVPAEVVGRGLRVLFQLLVDRQLADQVRQVSASSGRASRIADRADQLAGLSGRSLSSFMDGSSPVNRRRAGGRRSADAR